MRILILFASLAVALNAQTPVPKLWEDLAAKRQHLRFHQEIEVTRTSKSVGSSQNTAWKLTVDWADLQWHERSLTGWGTEERIFTGLELFKIDHGMGEYTRRKFRAKDTAELPEIYGPDELDWTKAVEMGKRPCRGKECSMIQVPFRKAARFASSGGWIRTLDGSAVALVDMASGVVLALRYTELEEVSNQQVSREVAYSTTDFRQDAVPPPGAFDPPSKALKEVKTLSGWNAKQLARAFHAEELPEWKAVDMNGEPISLSALHGKLVLLDIWAGWCPPCESDAPSVSKLQQQAGTDQLAVIGIAEGEERSAVEKFLESHRPTYPIVLSVENEIPRHFQMNTIPTYVLIGTDGKVVATAQGGQGFGGLKNLVKKAGLKIK